MIEFPIEPHRYLSDRARAFTGITVTREPAARTKRTVDPDGERDDLTEIRLAASAFDDTYRGISVHSLGGPLRGRVRLGVAGIRPVWRTGQGLGVFRCGAHPEIQCAVVASTDGRLGCSWSGEFSPLFDSVNLFMENAAAWGNVQGWRYAAFGDMSIESVVAVFGDLAVDASVRGKMATWWTGADHAVVIQQYLNPARSARPQVAVLARTSSAEEDARRRLARARVDPVMFEAAGVIGSVPMLHPR